jgi:hypothetical protein
VTAPDLVLAAQAFASAAMCGLIWFVQVVHYPLFAWVTGSSAQAYAAEHQRRTAVVVIPFMLVEGLTAALVAVNPPPGIPRSAAFAGLVIVLLLWAGTGLVQMPLHGRLGREGHVRGAVAALVRSNWLRTTLWTARGLLAVWMLRAAA